jgi:hypothetical protein
MKPLASPPVIGGTPAKHSGENNHPVKRVVVHSAVTPCEPGRARQLGEWNAAGSTGGSWHYSVDPVATFQCSYDRFVCWHAPPNLNSLGIEMADYPGPRPNGRVARLVHNARKAWRWNDDNHKAMLARTARLVAELLVAEKLPVKFVNAAALKRGERGWTTHAAVSRAFGQSDHWDPGWWPRRRFARMVEAQVRNIKENR